MRQKLDAYTCVGHCVGYNVEAHAKLTVSEEEDRIYGELLIAVRCGPFDLPHRWKIHWDGTLDVLQDLVPEYLRGHCPAPDQALQTLRQLDHPKYGHIFQEEEA
jgi:hypothetical protein